MSMYNQDTEVLFPSRVIPALRDLHGEEWQKLVDRIQSPDCTPAERHAFVLMMVKMSGCASCSADSFRAMRGCTACARQTVKRSKGRDKELVEQYQQLKREVDAHILKTSADNKSI